MRRIVLIGAAMIASLAMTLSASALPRVAPLTAQEDGSVVQVRHGGPHRGHMSRGHGHRHGWHRGRGHSKWHHMRRHYRR